MSSTPASDADGAAVDENDAHANERVFRLIGIGGGATSLVGFTAVGAIALESLAYGAVCGVFAGVGSALFLPWFLGLSAAQEAADGEISLSDAADGVPYSAQRGVFGLGLEIGAVVMIAVALTLDGADLLVGVPAALAVALAVYFVGSVALGR
ncbi:hypothetical protein [Halorubrum tibetense]|uniref:Uncharacterized protein n=1 Tax=Halorubrum tibetense TaxID=175631 RepID=A0ABD5S7Q7_9EURY